MKKLKGIRFFLLSLTLVLSAETSPLLAQELSGLKVNMPGFSVELELMLKQLAKSKSVSRARASQVVNAAKVINEDLKSVPRENALFLVKSEIYKALLDNPLVHSGGEIIINEAMLKSVEKKLQSKSIIYGEFAQWIAKSILADLAAYRKDGFISRYQTVSGSDVKERARSLELRKLAKFLSPWLMAINEKSPEEFNKLTTEVAANLMLRIASKTYYFHQFASKYGNSNSAQAVDMLAVPSIEASEKEQKLPSTSLKEESHLQELQGKEDLKALEKNELENPSNAIDNLMRNEQDQSKDGDWVPK